jgi:exopolysaccharide biosynthesis polyprenyl glycosylphosphotransferase
VDATETGLVPVAPVTSDAGRRRRRLRATKLLYEARGRDSLLSREAHTRRLLAGADGLAAVLAVVTVFALAAPQSRLWGALLLAPLVIFIHKVAGLYEHDELVLRRSTLDEFPVLLQVSSVFTLLVASVGEWLLGARPGPQQYVGLWIVATLLFTFFRLGVRSTIRAVRAPERCLVAGDPTRLAHVCEKLTARRDVLVTATLDIDAHEASPHARLSRLPILIERHDIHRVVVAPVSGETQDTVDLVRVAKAAGVRVSILPRILEAVGSAVEFEQLDGMPMLGVRQLGLARSSRRIKRAFDVVVGGLTFIAVLPIFVALMIVVKADSRGPIFFRQVRIGRDGTPFRMWKFRSMVVNAEAQKAELRHRNEAGDGMFKMADDPRVTRVGRFLRRTSLDELPQMLNVLTGDMSLVGPRPLVADEDALVQGLFRARLQLTPGMTGPWQILGSTRVPLDEMVGIDYLYVANWSLWADVKLLLRTVPHMLGRHGL